MGTRVCSCSCGCIGIRRGSLGPWVLISVCQLTSVIWVFSPTSLSGLSPVTCGGGWRWRIGSQELQWALRCLAMGWSSIFHFLDQPLSSPHLTHPLQLLLKLCKEFYFLSRGSTQPSCRWVVWLLVTGLRSGKLRSVNSFLRRVAAGTHQISREGDLCATGGEVSQVAVGLKGYWLHWRLPVASTDLHRDRHTQLLSLLSWGGPRVSDTPMLSPPCGLLFTPVLFWKQIGVLGPPLPFLVV